MDLNSLLYTISSISATTLSIVIAGLIAMLSIQYNRISSLISEANQILSNGESLRTSVRTLAQLKYFDQNRLRIKIEIFRSIIIDAKTSTISGIDHYYDNTDINLYDFDERVKQDINEFISLAEKKETFAVCERTIANLESIYYKQNFKFQKITLESIDKARLHTSSAKHKLQEIEESPHLNKRLIGWLFLSITFIYFVTVIYPIGLTPIDSFSELEFSCSSIMNSLISFESLLLSLIFITISSVLAYSFWQLKKVSVPDDVISMMREESNFDNIRKIHALYRDSFTYSEDIGKHFA